MEKKQSIKAISFLILLITVGSLFFLLVRCFELMIIKGSWFFKLSQENRIRKIKIEAARGEVKDRYGRQLISNRLDYCHWEEGECFSVVREKALKLKAKGETVETRFLRFYPLGSAAAHITGYLGQIAGDEKITCNGKVEIGFDSWVGRSGIEEIYDCQLRGQEGWKLVEADASGNILRELGIYPAQNGEEIRLTIDSWLQKIVAQAMTDQKGAVVALDPKNGEILALYSSPSFNPNKFTYERNDNLINQWLTDNQGMPFLNRAVSGAYHPGSVFKIISAIAGLESGKITNHTLIEDTGVIKIGQWEYANWYWTDYGRTEGMVDLVKAIQRSNDIYFYKLGEKIGAETIVEWARRFGIGEKLGIDLPGETGGILPSPKWKKEVKGEDWFLGNTYHLAIGQGDLEMTPLQVAVMTAVVVNQGQICQPHLRLQTNNEQTKICQSLGIKPDHLELVRKGMVEACAPGGTGFPFFDFQPVVGCKTGTAEVGDGSQDTHAWFTVFAPAENPTIVLTVFLERGGSGAYQAAPITKKILEEYFRE